MSYQIIPFFVELIVYPHPNRETDTISVHKIDHCNRFTNID